MHPPDPAHTCDVEDAVSNGGGRPGTRSGFGLQDTHHGFQLVQCLLQARVAHGLLAGHLWETRALPSLTRLLTPSSTPCPSSTITLAIIGWPPHLSEFSKPPFVMQLENAPQTLLPPRPCPRHASLLRAFWGLLPTHKPCCHPWPWKPHTHESHVADMAIPA